MLYMIVDKSNIESWEQSAADWVIDSFCVIIIVHNCVIEKKIYLYICGFMMHKHEEI